MGELAGVLFDVDGTLVDSAYLHAQCWHDAFRFAGHRIPTVECHRSVGMGSEEMLDHLLGPDHDKEQDDRISTAHKAFYRQYWASLEPLPGAADLLRECARRGLVVVLASSADEHELAALRRTIDADDVISVATSASDAKHAKPHADILEVALEKADLSPDQAFYVGDAVWDGVASSRVPMPFVGVECGGTSAAELRDAGAVATYANPAEMLTDLDTLLAKRSLSHPKGSRRAG